MSFERSLVSNKERYVMQLNEVKDFVSIFYIKKKKRSGFYPYKCKKIYTAAETSIYRVDSADTMPSHENFLHKLLILLLVIML